MRIPKCFMQDTKRSIPAWSQATKTDGLRGIEVQPNSHGLAVGSVRNVGHKVKHASI